MVFSHHSHSGEFCGHALDTLEECVQRAISLNMRVFALTEHMPRADPRDLYPEELAENLTPKKLSELFSAYYAAACRLREKYRDQITLLVGFEVDFIRPLAALSEIAALRKNYAFDIFVGSVHHVNGIPVDYDETYFENAMKDVNENGSWDWSVPPLPPSDAVGEFEMKYIDKEWEGTPMTVGEENLFAAYFDNQYAMLSSLQPPVIGHFDLIRLKCSDHTRPLPLNPRIWSLVKRNVSYIASYGGVVELNSAALRKGWSTPYPGKDVAQLMVDMGVKFCLSDDSHGIKQVGFGYEWVVKYLEELGVESTVCFEWEGLRRNIVHGELLEEKKVNGCTNGVNGTNGVNKTSGVNGTSSNSQRRLPEIGKVVKREVKVSEVKEAMTLHGKV